jgi:hypothetical protein
MKKLFAELMQTVGISGVVVLALNGKILHQNYLDSELEEQLSVALLHQFIETLGIVQEADIIFARRRVYVRRIPVGFLLVLMLPNAPMAMVRLQIDTLIPQLEASTKTKGLKRFFKLRK